MASNVERFLRFHSQDQVCDSNHAECVLFSRNLVTRRNTKAYFLQHNAGCFQLCNNPRFPVRSQSMGVKIMRIDLVAHRWVRELIADCLGPTFKTHVRSFMNKGHVGKNATKLPALSFHLEKLRLYACIDVACKLSLWGSREKPRESCTLLYNNVYGRRITTQYLRQIKENSKLNNGGFN